MAIRKKLERNRAGTTSVAIDRSSGAGCVRILSGKWRRTPLLVDSREGLRPTIERVRETVFDWIEHLMGGLTDRIVLDMFAGTGAMGLEAASRGATKVTLIERDRRSVQTLKKNIEKLQGNDVVVVRQGDAFEWVATDNENYDLVFIDPPFAKALQLKAMRTALRVLATDGLIYVESPLEGVDAQELEALGLITIRSGTAGTVVYELLARQASIMANLRKEPKTKGKRYD